jgi:hypothetical protein
MLVWTLWSREISLAPAGNGTPAVQLSRLPVGEDRVDVTEMYRFVKKNI